MKKYLLILFGLAFGIMAQTMVVVNPTGNTLTSSSYADVFYPLADADSIVVQVLTKDSIYVDSITCTYGLKLAGLPTTMSTSYTTLHTTDIISYSSDTDLTKLGTTITGANLHGYNYLRFRLIAKTSGNYTTTNKFYVILKIYN